MRTVSCRDDVLAGGAIEREEISIPRGDRDELSWLATNECVDEHGLLHGVPVVRIVRRKLVIPCHLSSVDVDGNERAGKQVVAWASNSGVCGCRIAGAENVQLRVGIV